MFVEQPLALPGSTKYYGIGATIRIGREIQCLPYMGFTISGWTWGRSEDRQYRAFQTCSIDGWTGGIGISGFRQLTIDERNLKFRFRIFVLNSQVLKLCHNM